MSELSEKARQERAEYYRQYRKNHPEIHNKANRRYRAEHPEKVREYNRRYWEKRAERQMDNKPNANESNETGDMING